MDKILKTETDLISGAICLKLEDKEGKQREIAFSRIRCGISWPLGNWPGYFCMVGLLNAAQIGAPGSLLFLKETEEELAEELLNQLMNTAKDLRVSEIFTDRRKPEWMGFGSAMAKQMRSLGLRDIRLQHVAFAENFTFGRDLIRKWGKSGALKIPEDSIIYAQLMGKEPPVFGENQQDQFYAVNALRYVATSFTQVPIRREEAQPRDNISVEGWA